MWTRRIQKNSMISKVTARSHGIGVSEEMGGDCLASLRISGAPPVFAIETD
jgi:hypothetical protein